MRGEQLIVEVVPSEGCVTVRLVGELDLSTAALVREAALAAMRQHLPVIRVDLSGVIFMDSTGLEALLATRRRAALEGGQLALVNPGRYVMRLLEISGLDQLFEIEEDDSASVG